MRHALRTMKTWRLKTKMILLTADPALSEPEMLEQEVPVDEFLQAYLEDLFNAMQPDIEEKDGEEMNDEDCENLIIEESDDFFDEMNISE